MSARSDGLTLRSTLGLECEVTLALFSTGEKCEKTPSPGSSASSSEPAGEEDEDVVEPCLGRKP